MQSLLGLKETLVAERGNEVSLREDRCEQQVSTSVDTYLLSEVGNDPLRLQTQVSTAGSIDRALRGTGAGYRNSYTFCS